MRNLKKEYEWSKKRYKEFKFRVKKEEAEEFLNLLNEKNIGYTEFFKTQIKKFIEENKK